MTQLATTRARRHGGQGDARPRGGGCGFGKPAGLQARVQQVAGSSSEQGLLGPGSRVGQPHLRQHGYCRPQTLPLHAGARHREAVFVGVGRLVRLHTPLPLVGLLHSLFREGQFTSRVRAPRQVASSVVQVGPGRPPGRPTRARAPRQVASCCLICLPRSAGCHYLLFAFVAAGCYGLGMGRASCGAAGMGQAAGRRQPRRRLRLNSVTGRWRGKLVLHVSCHPLRLHMSIACRMGRHPCI